MSTENKEAVAVLAIATKSTKGVVRGAKVEGMKNPAFVKTRKVAHVGMFIRVEKLTKAEKAARKAGRHINPKVFYREVENLAEFDGPTCEDACKTFLAMLPKCTRDSGVRCKADGKEAPVKLWRKVDFINPQEQQ